MDLLVSIGDILTDFSKTAALFRPQRLIFDNWYFWINEIKNTNSPKMYPTIDRCVPKHELLVSRCSTRYSRAKQTRWLIMIHRKKFYIRLDIWNTSALHYQYLNMRIIYGAADQMIDNDSPKNFYIRFRYLKDVSFIFISICQCEVAGKTRGLYRTSDFRCFCRQKRIRWHQEEIRSQMEIMLYEHRVIFK